MPTSLLSIVPFDHVVFSILNSIVDSRENTQWLIPYLVPMLKTCMKLEFKKYMAFLTQTFDIEEHNGLVFLWLTVLIFGYSLEFHFHELDSGIPLVK